jgi:hypothetical protein
MAGITDDGLRKMGVDALIMTICRFQAISKIRRNAGFFDQLIQGLTGKPQKCWLLRSGPPTSFLTITEKPQKCWALRSGPDHTLTTDFDGLSI